MLFYSRCTGKRSYISKNIQLRTFPVGMEWRMGWSMILSKIIKVCYGLLLGMGFMFLMVIIFKNYKSNMEDLGGLTNDRLLDIVEDKFGCIWVLCYDSTCYRFNPDKEVFEPVIQKTVNNFRSISVLPNGIVWLLCEDGSAVRVVTAPEDLSMTFQFYSSRENTLATGKIRSVFMDSKLQEWLLTDEGVYRLYDSELSIISLSDCRKSEKIPFYFATELEEYIYLGAHQGKVYKYLLTGELSIHTQLPTSASVISILPSVAGLIYVTDSDGFFLFMTLSVR